MLYPVKHTPLGATVTFYQHFLVIEANWKKSSISIFIKKKNFYFFRGVLHKNEELGVWGVPLPTDEPVVYRTQRYRYEVLGQRPLQFQQFIGLRSPFQGVGLLIGMAYFTFLCFFSWTRKLLLKVITKHCGLVGILWNLFL